MAKPLRLLAFAFAAAAAAQQRPEPSLHAAWLQELLDLDAAAAARDYRRIAEDTRTPVGERWLAASRLFELHRLEVPGVAAAPEPADAPESLRTRWREVQQTPPPMELLARARNAPAELTDWLGNNSHLRFLSRPLLPEAHRQAINQTGPGNRELRRQLLATLQGARQKGDRRAIAEAWRQLLLVEPELRDPRPFEHVRALFILKCELGGRSAQAARLREQYFRDWQPPAVEGNAGDWLATVTSNLAAMLKTEDLIAGEDEQLQQLKERLARGGDNVAAIEMIRRVPFYAERLLRRE